MRWMKFSLVAVLATTALAACDDATGGDDTGRAEIFMSRTSVANAATEYAANYVAGLTGVLSIGQVDSLFVRVTSVSALHMGSDTSESSGGWETIELADSGGKRINLMGLPAAAADSVKLARGDIAAGTYKNIRLGFDSAAATIVLKDDVTVGGHTFTKGTSYPLRIPSGRLKIAGMTFTVGEDSASAVTLVFDAANSVNKVTATGSGKLQISPVIHKK